MISYLQAVLMGLLQGLTEFLPVSSSGHVMILNEWLGADLEGGLLGLFTVLLHLGTLVAVLICYRKTIIDMIRHPLRSDLKLLVLATIPTVAYTLALKFLGWDETLDGLARTLLPWCFFLTAIFMFLADKAAQYHLAARSMHKRLRWYDALVMGLMQCIGTFNGVSRSGSTILGGLSTGLSRKRVADFSFMMSIPAILGALALEVMDIAKADGLSGFRALSPSLLPVLAGVAVAGIAGFLAIKFMLMIIQKLQLKWFALYVGLLGAVILVNDLLIPLW